MLVLLMGGIFNCAVEMGSGAVIYIQFHKDWFWNSEVNREDT
jgi:hypothetical protein